MRQIILEGADACGKSTLAANLVTLVEKRHPHIQVRVVREPGDSIKGLRDICIRAEALDLAGQSLGKPTPLASATLFIAGMVQTDKAVYKWAAEVAARGKEAFVIRDRSIISTLIYQGFLGAGPAGVRTIWAMYQELLSESFDRVYVLLGNHKHRGPSNMHSGVGQGPHIQKLYASVQKLLGPLDAGGLDGHNLALVREMSKAMKRADRVSFYQRFPDWKYINTNELDAAATAEFVLLGLQKAFKWT